MENLDWSVNEKKEVLLYDGRLYDKMKAHIEGKKHYACSVVVINDKFEILLQRRSANKYHSGNLWSNACCTHPLSSRNEDIEETVKDRLFFEMGIKTKLNFLFTFSYNTLLRNGLIENEYDFVFEGFYNASPVINKNEVSEFKWIKLECLRNDMLINADCYTDWFHVIMQRYSDYIDR